MSYPAQAYGPWHQGPALTPLVVGTPEYQAAYRAYQAAAAAAFYKGPIDPVWHILWLLVTLCTFGIGIIPWIIHASRGKPMLRPGWPAPSWPPPGYYVEYNRKSAH